MALKVGIISANWGAMAHLPAWRAVEGVEVTGICTSRRETATAAAQRFDIPRAFWDYEAMCADPEFDIIDCGTRPNLRRSMVLSALAGGKHVYNGVPFAASLEDAHDMRTAQATAGRVGVVDAFSQWLPAHRLLSEVLAEGEIGEVAGGLCRFNTALFNPPRRDFPFNWFAEAGTGVSAVRNMGSHMLHMLMVLLGPIAEVAADDRMIVKEWRFPDGGEVLTPQNSDFANAMLRFESGAIMQMQISWSAACGDGWLIDLFGARGRATAVSNENFPTSKGCVLHLGKAGGAMSHREVPARLTRAEGVKVDWSAPMPPVFPMALAMRSMVDAIGADSAHAAPDFEQAWQVERVLEAIGRASLQRRWVLLAEIA